jgi:hypothetical protein
VIPETLTSRFAKSSDSLGAGSEYSAASASASARRSATTGPAGAPTCSRSSATPATASSPRGVGTRRTETPWCSRSPTPRRVPELLEIPFQFCSTDLVRPQRLRRGAAFGRALRGAWTIAERDLVFATAFHEWCAVEANEEEPAGSGH